MTVAFPPRNLPGPAENWGRAHDNAAKDFDARLSTLSQNVANQNRNAASTLASISESLSEISQQVTYVAEDPFYEDGGGATEATTFPWVGPIGSVVRFEVKEKRRVKVELSVAVFLSAINDGVNIASPAYIQSYLHFAWAGSTSVFRSPVDMSATPAAGIQTGFSRYERLSIHDFHILGPGQYSVGFAPEVTRLTERGFARYYLPRVSVQLLERA